MAEIVRSPQPVNMKRKEEGKIYGVFTPSILTKKISLSIREIGKNMKDNLERKLAFQIEGKCISEGFIRPGSIRIITYSSGIIQSDYIDFHVTFECMICNPVEGMLIECTVKTVTKAGVHAEVILPNDVVPVVVFVARDHHYNQRHFNDIKENQTIVTRVIRVRYELNDPNICVIAEWVEK